MESSIKCMFPRRVSPELVAMLPLVKCPDEIVLIQTDDALDIALEEIAKESLLGFDTETRPSFSRSQHYKVSILQLSGEHKTWIIRLIPLEHRLAEIYAVLENAEITKAGLAVQGDIRSLGQRLKINAGGFVDISKFTSQMGIINTGMKNLAAVFLGERVSKSSQMSNWEAEELTKKQIDYAATDSWISRRLYLEVKRVLDEGKFDVEPEPEPEPEPFSIIRFMGEILKSAKSACNSARRKIKSLLLPKPPKRKKRRRRKRKNA